MSFTPYSKIWPHYCDGKQQVAAFFVDPDYLTRNHGDIVEAITGKRLTFRLWGIDCCPKWVARYKEGALEEWRLIKELDAPEEAECHPSFE